MGKREKRGDRPGGCCHSSPFSLFPHTRNYSLVVRLCPVTLYVLMMALSDGDVDAGSGSGSSSDAPALIWTCACTREAENSVCACLCVCVEYTHRVLAIPRLFLLFLFFFWRMLPKRGIVPCHPPCSPLYFSSCLYSPPLCLCFLFACLPPAHPYCVRISVRVCVCVRGQQKLLLRPFSIGCVFLFLFSVLLLRPFSVSFDAFLIRLRQFVAP